MTSKHTFYGSWLICLLLWFPVDLACVMSLLRRQQCCAEVCHYIKLLKHNRTCIFHCCSKALGQALVAFAAPQFFIFGDVSDVLASTIVISMPYIHDHSILKD